MMDTSELIVIAIVAALGAVSLVIAVRWRRMIAGSPRLPLWGFLRREGITRDDAADNASARAVKQAELACSVCGSRQECRGQLSTGSLATPPAHCPNRRLFREFGLWTGRRRE